MPDHLATPGREPFEMLRRYSGLILIVVTLATLVIVTGVFLLRS
jgi:hypothetical protein